MTHAVLTGLIFGGPVQQANHRDSLTHIMAERRWRGCATCAVETSPAFPSGCVQTIPLTVAACRTVGAVLDGHVVLVGAEGAGRAGEGLSGRRATGAVEPCGAGRGVDHRATCQHDHHAEG